MKRRREEGREVEKEGKEGEEGGGRNEGKGF